MHRLGEVTDEDTEDLLREEITGLLEGIHGNSFQDTIIELLQSTEDKIGALRFFQPLMASICREEKKIVDSCLRLLQGAMKDSLLVFEATKQMMDWIANTTDGASKSVVDQLWSMLLFGLKRMMLDDVCHPQAISLFKGLQDIYEEGADGRGEMAALQELIDLLMAIASKKNMPFAIRNLVLWQLYNFVDATTQIWQTNAEKEKTSELVERFVNVLLLNLGEPTCLDTQETSSKQTTTCVCDFVNNRFTKMYSEHQQWTEQFTKMAEKLSDGTDFHERHSAAMLLEQVVLNSNNRISDDQSEEWTEKERRDVEMLEEWLMKLTTKLLKDSNDKVVCGALDCLSVMKLKPTDQEWRNGIQPRLKELMVGDRPVKSQCARFIRNNLEKFPESGLFRSDLEFIVGRLKDMMLSSNDVMNIEAVHTMRTISEKERGLFVPMSSRMIDCILECVDRSGRVCGHVTMLCDLSKICVAVKSENISIAQQGR